MAGATIEHMIDSDTNQFMTKFRTEMSTCQQLAHEKRAAEPKGKGMRFKNLIRKGRWKSLGFAPLTIYRHHPEFKFDRDAPKKWLERHPDLKCTNAKLI